MINYTSAIPEEEVSGEHIVAGREALSWSQPELAHRACVKQQVVAEYETNSKFPGRKYALAIRQALESTGHVRFVDGGIWIREKAKPPGMVK